MQYHQRGAQRLSRGAAALALLLTVPAIGAAPGAATRAWGQTPHGQRPEGHTPEGQAQESQAPPIVRTRSGSVSGTAAKLPGVRAYLGIPFAAPPVGDRRWRPPAPMPSWKGTRAADHFSPSCIQGPNTPFGPWTAEFLLLGPTSEDCLYLNVWTAAKPNARQPVLVYIYGGGFGSGSGDVPVYDGSHLAAEQGLVVVNMNYRVGALGFLAFPELTREAGASGNYGLMDQVAALEWVQGNIAAFGGDPRRVMIAGQSAGAMSVFLHTASPMAKGLFQRAAIESGPGGLAAFGIATARSVTRPRADAEQEGVAYAGKLGAKSLAELRALPAAKFIGGGRFGPVVDGRFLVEEPTATFEAGRQNDVPTLTGLNADEGSASPGYGKATPIERARDAGVAGLERLLGERARTSHTPAFAYYFDRAIPWPEHPEFGAFHTGEVPYVFGTLDALDRPWTDVDRTLSKTMMSYWANFAATGDPNGAGLPRWAAFDAASPSLVRLGEKVEPKKPLLRDRNELAAQGSAPLPRSSPEREGISSSAVLDFVQAADTSIDAMNSFMLVRHGRVVAEGWWGPYAPATPHVLYSLSKSFTSTAVGLAAAEGKLSIDDPVLKFFPDQAPAQPSENLKAMRVRDLLRIVTGNQTEARETHVGVEPRRDQRGGVWIERAHRGHRQARPALPAEGTVEWEADSSRAVGR